MKNIKSIFQEIEWPTFKNIIVGTLSTFIISCLLCAMIYGWNILVDACVNFVLSLF